MGSILLEILVLCSIAWLPLIKIGPNCRNYRLKKKKKIPNHQYLISRKDSIDRRLEVYKFNRDPKRGGKSV